MNTLTAFLIPLHSGASNRNIDTEPFPWWVILIVFVFMGLVIWWCNWMDNK